MTFYKLKIGFIRFSARIAMLSEIVVINVMAVVITSTRLVMMFLVNIIKLTILPLLILIASPTRSNNSYEISILTSPTDYNGESRRSN